MKDFANLKYKFLKEISDSNKNPLKIDYIDDPKKKNEVNGEKSNFQENGQNFFSNLVYLYNKSRKKLQKFRLKLNEEDIYYSETTTLYIHDYHKKIYFFNVCGSNGQMENLMSEEYNFTENIFKSDKDEKKNILNLKQIAFYFDDEKKGFLKDFSICASKEIIYLIWGFIVSPNQTMQGINDKIYAFSMTYFQWREIELNTSSLPIMPRIKTSSCVFEQKDSERIYILGGTGFEIDFDYYNVIERIQVNKKTWVGDYRRIPKQDYNQNTYKSMNDGILIYRNSNENIDQLLLIGGTSSQFSQNQKNYNLNACLINITETQEKFAVSFKQLFTGKTKNLEIMKYNEMNLFLSQVTKKYTILEKHAFRPMISCFNYELKEFLNDKTKKISKTFFMKKDELVNIRKFPLNNEIKTLVCVISFSKFDEDFGMKCQINGLKTESLMFPYQSMTFFEQFLKKVEADHILISDERPGLMLLTHKKILKENRRKYNYDDFFINFLEFSFPDLGKRKPNYKYPDYLLSQTKISKYCKCDDEVYILINTPRDNKNCREIYSFKLTTVDLKIPNRIEPLKVYSDNVETFGSSLHIDSNRNLYIIGGKLPFQASKEIKYNKIIVDMEKNLSFELPNNINTFIHPYVFSYDRHVFCVDRLQKTDQKFIYGEVINFSKLKDNSEWSQFKISVSSLEVFTPKSKTFKPISSPHGVIIEKLVPIGRRIKGKQNEEVFLVDYENESEKKIKRLIFLKLNLLISLLYNKNNKESIKFIVEAIDLEGFDMKNYRMESEECSYRIADDNSSGNYSSDELLFFNSNDIDNLRIADFRCKNKTDIEKEIEPKKPVDI